jgi:hypothetical protein
MFSFKTSLFVFLGLICGIDFLPGLESFIDIHWLSKTACALVSRLFHPPSRTLGLWVVRLPLVSVTRQWHQNTPTVDGLIATSLGNKTMASTETMMAKQAVQHDSTFKAADLTKIPLVR